MLSYLTFGVLIQVIDDIIKEKISADHLLYVSLKYTKTCDVIINLLLRWKIMIDKSMEVLVENAKKKKKWKKVPDDLKQARAQSLKFITNKRKERK